MLIKLFAPQLTIALLAALCAAPAHAQTPVRKPAQASASAPQGSGDKLDVSDLEKKYWAAKDTDFNVVQNRLFSKAGRLGLTLNYGMYVGEPWSKGPTYGASLNYFFNERYGVEFAYSKTDSSDNDATVKLKQQSGSPNHTKLKGYYGVGFNWVPFYAKMSFLNSSIVYFDMSITPGVGIVSYEQQKEEGNAMQNTVGFSLAITQHFFLTKWLALRLDYKNYWYNEDMVAYRVNSRALNSSGLKNDGLLMGGFTFYY